MVAYRQAKTGELILSGSEVKPWLPENDSSAPHPILEKIDTGRPMSEFPFDKYSNVPGTENCLFFVDGEWIEGYGIPASAASFVLYGHREQVQPLGWKPKDE